MTGSFVERPFVLDKLPPDCALSTEARRSETGATEFRFQAMRAGGDRSEWSGWFVYNGEPIALTWDAFWVEPTEGAE